MPVTGSNVNGAGRPCPDGSHYLRSSLRLPGVLRGYGESRALRMDDRQRMVRATDGQDVLRADFNLGVNFVGSLVNRRRIELFAGLFHAVQATQHVGREGEAPA